MERKYAREIKSVCENFLNRIHVPFETRQVDPVFFDDCCKAARDMGTVLDNKTSILPYLKIGSDYAALAYGHLEYETQIFYTALPDRFESLAAEAMLQSALDFCVGLVLEYELLEKPVLSRSSTQFPAFLRDLTGISRLYGILIFPDGLPLRVWIESMPSIIKYIQFSNDVLSFYKEELANESNNYISVKARSKGCTNLEALQMLADETVEAYEETVAVLEHSPEALEAFKHFSGGNAYWHIDCKRYRLAELWASDSS